MITNSTIGERGLGNQLFQYAVLKRISLEKGYELALRLSKKGCRLAEFEISGYTILRKEDLKTITNICSEKHFHFDSSILNVQQNTDIRGYFQSERYFTPVYYIIRKDLALKDKTINETVIDFTESRRKKSLQLISIHVRRGDYTLETNLKRHPFPGLNYYHKAMNFFKDEDRFMFVVLSDDMEWCKENLKQDNIEYSPFSKDIEDLALMQACDHNIIANSSFSWWGAWLNNNPHKRVIAPKKWFGPDMYQLRTPLRLKVPYFTKDLIPKTWIKI